MGNKYMNELIVDHGFGKWMKKKDGALTVYEVFPRKLIQIVHY